MHHGTLITDGEVEPVIREYLKFGAQNAGINLDERKDRSGNGALRFERIDFLDDKNESVGTFHSGSSNTIRLTLNKKNNQSLSQVVASVAIDDAYGQRITHISNEATQISAMKQRSKLLTAFIQIKRLLTLSYQSFL